MILVIGLIAILIIERISLQNKQQSLIARIAELESGIKIIHDESQVVFDSLSFQESLAEFYKKDGDETELLLKLLKEIHNTKDGIKPQHVPIPEDNEDEEEEEEEDDDDLIERKRVALYDVNKRRATLRSADDSVVNE